MDDDERHQVFPGSLVTRVRDGRHESVHPAIGLHEIPVSDIRTIQLSISVPDDENEERTSHQKEDA